MRCSVCQFENPAGARFCMECGAKMERNCPNCGRLTPPGSKFCMDCGHDLRQPAAPKPDTEVEYSNPKSYTPKHLADKILTTRSSLEGERKLVTVLFADVAGYTALSEKIDPEEIHQIMDECFRILMDEIHGYEGTINQFTGDGIMALFGAPVAHEDHAQRACRAALDIQMRLKPLEERVRRELGIEFKMRLGLNSGPVIVGAIGDDLRMDYTAVGDTTNLAARLQSLAKPGRAVISEETYRLVKAHFEFEHLGKAQIKGKEQPQAIYELLKPSAIGTRFEASVAKGLTKFVGRQNSMEALTEVWEKARGGQGQLASLVGEAGVGKSRILLEFRNRIDEDVLFLEGRCVQFGGTIPYLPILDILRSYFGIEEGEREFLVRKKLREGIIRLDENLPPLLEPIEELFSLKVEDQTWNALEPKLKRERTFEALRDLLIRLSQNETLIMAVDDLHWIDKTSEEFLGYFIDWISASRVLLIILYRPEYNHQWGGKTYYTRIGLSQLTAKSSSELVQAILGEGEMVPELKEFILGRAAGNPLFMEELTCTMVENGSIDKKDNRFVLARQTPELQVPETIQGIIAARMDRLDDNLKRTMQVASVIGRNFAYRVLQAIDDIHDDLKTTLFNLQGLEFIYKKQLFPELEYIFKHALTQEVAYNSLLLQRKRELHGRIGRAIEELYAERLEELYEVLAYHFARSDRLETAVQYLELAGKKATASFANREAFRFLEEAALLLLKLPSTLENRQKQVRIARQIAHTSFLLFFPEGSLPLIRDGATVAKSLGDDKSCAFLNMHIANMYNFIGDVETAIIHGEKSFEEADKSQDIEIMVQMGMMLNMAYINRGEVRKISRFIPKVIAIIEKESRQSEFFNMPVHPYSYFCTYYGYATFCLGDFASGLRHYETGLKHAQETGDLLTLAMAECAYTWALIQSGNFESGCEHGRKSIEYSEKTGLVITLCQAWAYIGLGYYYLGDLAEAENHLLKSLDMQNTLGAANMWQAIIYGYLSMLYTDREQPDRALEFAERAVEVASFPGMSQLWLGRALYKKGPEFWERAEKTLLEGIEGSERIGKKLEYCQGYYWLGEFYAEKGLPEKSRETLKQAEAMFQEMNMTYWLNKTRKIMEQLP